MTCIITLSCDHYRPIHFLAIVESKKQQSSSLDPVNLGKSYGKFKAFKKQSYRKPILHYILTKALITWYESYGLRFYRNIYLVYTYVESDAVPLKKLPFGDLIHITTRVNCSRLFLFHSFLFFSYLIFSFSFVCLLNYYSSSFSSCFFSWLFLSLAFFYCAVLLGFAIGVLRGSRVRVVWWWRWWRRRWWRWIWRSCRHIC